MSCYHDCNWAPEDPIVASSGLTESHRSAIGAGPSSHATIQVPMTKAELHQRIENVIHRDEELAVRAIELDDQERCCANKKEPARRPPLIK